MNEKKPETGVVGAGTELVKEWVDAHSRVQRLRSEINRQECNAANATIALARFLIPTGVKTQVGEKFCIWFGDSLIQVEIGDNGNHNVTIRMEGKSIREISHG